MDTTIKLERGFKDWIKSKGKKGETYQDIIKRLIKDATNKHYRTKAK